MIGISPEYLFQQTLSSTLLHNPTQWRERRIIHIKPLTKRLAYNWESIQFFIESKLVEQAKDRTILRLQAKGFSDTDIALFDFNIKSQIAKREIYNLVLPLAVLPKRLILGFSVYDREGKKLPIKTRNEAKEFTCDYLDRFIDPFFKFETFDDIDLRDSIERIIKVLVYCQPDNLERELGHYGLSERTDNLEKITPFKEWFKDRILKYITKEEGDILNSYNWNDYDDILRNLHDIFKEYHTQEYPLSYKGFMNPVINPLILMLDYYYLNRREGKRINAILDQYLFDVRKYLEFLINILSVGRNEKSSISTLLGIINHYTYNWVVYVPIKAIIDREDVLKFEQLLPLTKVRESIKERKLWIIKTIKSLEGEALGYLGNMNKLPCNDGFMNKSKVISGKASQIYSKYKTFSYEVAIGDAKTTHIEISSPNPAQVILDPSGSFVEIYENRMHPEKVFGYTSSYSETIQHFYTTKRLENLKAFKDNQIEAIPEKERSKLFKRREIQREKHSDYLTIYNVIVPRKDIKWLYRISCAISIITLIALLSMKEKIVEGTYIMLPITITINAAIISTRESEPTLSDIIYKYKIILCITTFIMWMVVLIYSVF